MLFNSYAFLLVFLPAALFIFYTSKSNTAPKIFLLSLVFYSYWEWRFTAILLLSLAFNYLAVKRTDLDKTKSFIIAGNLLLLFFFKYAIFLMNEIGSALSLPTPDYSIALPLGISFYTFQQISYVFDVRRGAVEPEGDFLKYGAYVTFFPQLIAGPIVRYRQIQKDLTANRRPIWDSLIVGLTIFSIGLAKKVLIADSLAPYADSYFSSIAGGSQTNILEAWAGVLAYTFQLYFDFSGYSDMAIGLGRMFGIKLPFNFLSPYKATTVTEFWRRWHVTLSTWLRDYLYIPLGGSKGTVSRTYANLAITMILGGIWHGAGWNFMIWGMLHGAYLVEERLFTLPLLERAGSKLLAYALWPVTFAKIAIGWVFFRAPDFESAKTILAAMVDFNSIVLPASLDSAVPRIFDSVVSFSNKGFLNFGDRWGIAIILVAAMISLLGVSLFEAAPSIAHYDRSAKSFTNGYGFHARWRKLPAYQFCMGIVCSVLVIFSLVFMARPTTFLYFQF